MRHYQPFIYQTMMENVCKNTKSSEIFEVNEVFLNVSERIIPEIRQKTPNEAINLLVGKLKLNDLCSNKLKVLDLSPDYFNGVIDFGGAPLLVKVAEALKEAGISSIAEEIANRPAVKMVLIAGPSSSGKTTFCKKLSYALEQQGLKPQSISLDDYYTSLDKVPRDDKGDYDFESLYALDLDLFQEHLNALLRGEEVEVPKYLFKEGRAPHGTKMRLEDNSILLLEGIHGLNPLLTGDAVAKEHTFRVYLSALTTYRLGNGEYFPTTDNRLLRRIVRDASTRGTTAQHTIAMWDAVRKGEEKWIVPFQGNADVNFDSGFQYEISLLKVHALPLLREIGPECAEYSMAQRLIGICEKYHEIPVELLPPYSILREFLGNSKYKY